MANQKIRGITIEIDGDTSGLKKSLANVNSELKSTDAQLKDVEKLLKLDPTNTELLAQKQKLLKDAIGQSKDKLETLKQAEADLKSKGVDENSQQFMALRREIASTEQSIDGYEKEANNAAKTTDKTTEAAEKSEEAHSGLGATLGTVGKAFGAMATAAAAGTVALGKSLIDASTSGAAYADEILTLSTVTGISTDRLQEFAYASELVDVSVDTLTGSMTKNIRAMSNAADGSATYVEAYEKLGVAVTDANGELRDSETVYWEVIDALGNIQNETERDALAMELLGKSAQDLNPLIAAGSETLAELADEAHEVGYVLDEETLSSYGALDDATQRLKTGTTALKNSVGQVLLPVLTKLTEDGAEMLGEFTGQLNESGGDFSQLGEVVGNVLSKMMDKISESLPTIIDTAMGILFSLLDAIGNNLPALLDRLVPLLIKLIDMLIDRLPQIIQSLLGCLIAIVNALVDVMPDLIPAIIDAVLAIVDLLLDPEMVAKLTIAAIKLVIAVVKGVVEKIPDILKSLWDAIVGFFAGIGSAIKNNTDDGMKALLNKVIGGLNSVIAVPFRGINWVLNKIKNLEIFGATPFSWVNTIDVPEIPMLAKGGEVLRGSAIVGEAGPELLTVANGRTIVQPLSPTSTINHNHNASVNVNVYGAIGQDVSALADEVAQRIQFEITQKAGAY